MSPPGQGEFFDYGNSTSHTFAPSHGHPCGYFGCAS